MSIRAVVVTIFTLTAVLTVAFAVSAQSADPWFGTWKANQEKSKSSPGPAPKSFVVKMEQSEGGFKETLDVVAPGGQTAHVETIGKFDGKDYPTQGPPPPGWPDAIRVTHAFKRIDDRTYEITEKVDGKVANTVRVVHSADGKTSVATVTGKDARGQAQNGTVFLDRQ